MSPSQGPLRIVVLSGPICSGKSELARGLHERYGAHIIKTRELIKQRLPSTRDERGALQRAGERLDKNDNGAWVRDELVRYILNIEGSGRSNGLYVVDSARIVGQIEVIRDAYGVAVHHIHVTADESELARRYKRRSAKTREFKDYSQVRSSPTEKNIEKLADYADIVVATDRCTADAVLVRATALLGLYPRSNVALVDVIVGGQYGSEGKGNIVGHIAQEYDLLVRVGGPNAGHSVYGEPVEIYHHLPSGSGRSPNATLLLGAGAVINVQKLRDEISLHKIPATRLKIDPQAMIIEEKDIEWETGKLEKTISSTAQGVGKAAARKILGRGKNIDVPVRLARDVPELKHYISDGQEVLEEAYRNGSRVLLEGTQGTSLSIHHGKYPHVTSRDTAVAGCLADAGIAPMRVRRIIMVCRTIPIRVGGPSGPMEFPISYNELSRRSGIPVKELKKIEKTTTTKKQRRLGEFDWGQLRRSTLLNGPTDIALTFADYLSVKNRSAYRFEQLTPDSLRFIEEVERVSGVPVSMISTDFNWRNVIDRRAW